MALIVAPAANANSYVLLADANDYHSMRGHNEAWTSIESDAAKEPFLQWASRLLDALDWSGQKSDMSNALRFPRSGLVDLDKYVISSDSIPTFLSHATSELAMYLAESDTTKTEVVEQSSIKVGTITIENNTDIKDKNPIPDHVMDMVRPWLNDVYGLRIIR